MNKSQALPKLATYIGNPRRHRAVIPRLVGEDRVRMCFDSKATQQWLTERGYIKEYFIRLIPLRPGAQML
jgi:hypothetical protein